jgi:hypothetical protein
MVDGTLIGIRKQYLPGWGTADPTQQTMDENTTIDTHLVGQFWGLMGPNRHRWLGYINSRREVQRCWR